MKSITGQWLGTADGVGGSATIVLNIDSQTPNQGMLGISEHNSHGKYWSTIHITKAGSLVRGAATLSQFVTQPPPDISTTTPMGADIEAELVSDREFRGTWKSINGHSGGLTLRFWDDDTRSEPDITFDDWTGFKAWALKRKAENPDLVYRGVGNNNYRLRTTFHRTGRRDIIRYAKEDIPRLQRALSSMLSRVYDLDNPIHYGAFLYLAQHHGFPTPAARLDRVSVHCRVFRIYVVNA